VQAVRVGHLATAHDQSVIVADPLQWAVRGDYLLVLAGVAAVGS